MKRATAARVCCHVYVQTVAALAVMNRMHANPACPSDPYSCRRTKCACVCKCCLAAQFDQPGEAQPYQGGEHGRHANHLAGKKQATTNCLSCQTKAEVIWEDNSNRPRLRSQATAGYLKPICHGRGTTLDATRLRMRCSTLQTARAT
jgi:hypothetical protein